MRKASALLEKINDDCAVIVSKLFTTSLPLTVSNELAKKVADDFGDDDVPLGENTPDTLNTALLFCVDFPTVERVVWGENVAALFLVATPEKEAVDCPVMVAFVFAREDPLAEKDEDAAHVAIAEDELEGYVARNPILLIIILVPVAPVIIW